MQHHPHVPHRCALVIMTRVPIAGKTKTRLISQNISASQAAKVHQCFLKELALTLHKLPTFITPYLYISDEGPPDIVQALFPSDMPMLQQPQGHLGERMQHAFIQLLAQGFEQVILIGSDIPQVQVCDITEASSALQQHDLVYGPTTDGGYYLIGMKAPLELPFSSTIQWGTPSAFQDSLTSLQNTYSVALIRTQYDIDTKEDLAQLYQDTHNSQQCSHLRTYITQHLRDALYD